MDSNWHKIWERRTEMQEPVSVLEKLIALDGYDYLGKIEESHWREYVAYLASKIELRPGEQVFEVGCGAGAILYPLYEQGFSVSGLDYSKALIDYARKAMPDGSFIHAQASELPVEPVSDAVLSVGAFLFFGTYDYARVVLQKMLQKARRVVCLADVADLEKKEVALQRRRGAMGAEEYDKKYAGLDHLYFPRTWFAENLDAQQFRVEIEPQAIAHYMHADYRYNVFIHRR